MFRRARRAFVLVPVSVAALLVAVPVCATTPPSTTSLRLGKDVVPTFQAIRLELDPRKADYTGSVEIDLDVPDTMAGITPPAAEPEPAPEASPVGGAD